MRIEPATLHDVQAAVDAYAYARTVQLAHGSAAWLGFDATAIRQLVDAGQLFCAREADEVMAVFVVLEQDPAIWDDADADRYLYLHRVARAEACHTPGVFALVMEWMRSRCVELGRFGVRIDTWSDNEGLLSYYERFGFRLVGARTMPVDPHLPPHYHGIELALLEQRVTDTSVPPR
ncbi:MAG TPA: hypothetical protein VHB25_11740 [Gemmatimonadaceae bacterium]|nr:hypothetical protein [Gemmatimonadaceae bacterium]